MIQSRRRHARRGVVIGFTGLAALVLGARSPVSGAEHVMEYRNGHLTVRVAKEPVAEVLTEVGRVTGAEVRGAPLDAREVTATFDAVPIDEALRRLLGEQAFSLTYRGERLAVIDLLDQSGAIATPIITGSPADLARRPKPHPVPEEGSTPEERAWNLQRRILMQGRDNGAVGAYDILERVR